MNKEVAAKKLEKKYKHRKRVFVGLISAVVLLCVVTLFLTDGSLTFGAEWAIRLFVGLGLLLAAGLNYRYGKQDTDEIPPIKDFFNKDSNLATDFYSVPFILFALGLWALWLPLTDSVGSTVPGTWFSKPIHTGRYEVIITPTGAATVRYKVQADIVVGEYVIVEKIYWPEINRNSIEKTYVPKASQQSFNENYPCQLNAENKFRSFEPCETEDDEYNVELSSLKRIN